MEVMYYGVSLDGTTIESLNLSDIIDNPHVNFFLKRIYQSKSEILKLYKYIPIDKNDQFLPIKVGDYELIDIGPDSLDGDYHRVLTYYDTKAKKQYQRNSKEYKIKFLASEVIPFLNELLHYGSFEAYEKYENLTAENKKQKETITRLEKEIEKLKSEQVA